MELRKGLYKNILVCDFKSIYPTIVRLCNINPYVFKHRPRSDMEKNDDVTVTKHTTSLVIGNVTVTFDFREESVTQMFMKYQIEEREKNKGSLPVHAKTLKVSSNSFYGSFSYDNSTLYSPLCAAAFNAIGRHCIKLARRYFLKEGLQVIYGDTDSCMVTCGFSREGNLELASSALSRLHAYMPRIPLYLMRVAVEDYYWACAERLLQSL